MVRKRKGGVDRRRRNYYWRTVSGDEGKKEKNGKTKMSKKTERDIIMVDFDGTLTTGGRFWTNDVHPPNQKMIDWVNNEYHKGNVIIIFTARPYETMRKTVAWLIEYGVKYHGINMDKPGAQMYIDDKSINPNELFEQEAVKK